MARTVEVSCLVDIEETAESFHAYAVPDGIDINPGDVVVLHDPPSRAEFGTRRTGACRATVIRAGLLGRMWTRARGLFQLTDLYEVGFQPKEAP